MEEVIRNENLNYSNIIREKSRITSIHGNIVKKSQKYSIKYNKKIFKYLISINIIIFTLSSENKIRLKINESGNIKLYNNLECEINAPAPDKVVINSMEHKLINSSFNFALY